MMKGIGVDNIYGNNSCGTKSFETKLPTTEDIFASMGYILIKVPKGPSICPIFHQSKDPELFCDERLLDKDAIYIISGMGIVAGEDAYKKLKNSKLLLWWK